MPTDSTETRARLRAAAVAEFAAYGIAGARVERIAAAAGVNKQLIYRYYGDKERLFETILQQELQRAAGAVVIDPDDLPGFVGAAFDYAAAHPDSLRLVYWDKLERATPVATVAEAAAYRDKVAAVATAQRRGHADASIPAADLLALLSALATAWITASPALRQHGNRPAGAARELARHRAIAVDAARRLITGTAGSVNQGGSNEK